jgi:hypothetical protein
VNACEHFGNVFVRMNVCMYICVARMEFLMVWSGMYDNLGVRECMCTCVILGMCVCVCVCVYMDTHVACTCICACIPHSHILTNIYTHTQIFGMSDDDDDDEDDEDILHQRPGECERCNREFIYIYICMYVCMYV